MVYRRRVGAGGCSVLKLTPQSQYGILAVDDYGRYDGFEVDSTESIWYTSVADYPEFFMVLKLTPQSQYGIRFSGRWRR